MKKFDLHLTASGGEGVCEKFTVNDTMNLKNP